MERPHRKSNWSRRNRKKRRKNSHRMRINRSQAPINRKQTQISRSRKRSRGNGKSHLVCLLKICVPAKVQRPKLAEKCRCTTKVVWSPTTRCSTVPKLAMVSNSIWAAVKLSRDGISALLAWKSVANVASHVRQMSHTVQRVCHQPFQPTLRLCSTLSFAESINLQLIVFFSSFNYFFLYVQI